MKKTLLILTLILTMLAPIGYVANFESVCDEWEGDAE